MGERIVARCVALVAVATLVPALAAAGAGQDTGPRQAARTAICVVHCDPVGPEQFESNWALLGDLVNTADQYGARLSLHFTGSYASLALAAGKAAQMRSWLARGHDAGSHPHPEYTGHDGWIATTWNLLPQEKVEQAVAQTTGAVNVLVVAEANRVLDTLLPFYTTPADFPVQFTHFAWGNNGHPMPVRIVLPRDRAVTAVFYRSLPGDPVDRLHLTAAQMLEEMKEGDGEVYGPVLHPLDFQGSTRRELITWFASLSRQGIPTVPVARLKSCPPTELDRFMRVRCDVVKRDKTSATASVSIENLGGRPLRGLKLVVHLPADYALAPGTALSPPATRRQSSKEVFEWVGQTVPARGSARYELRLGPVEKPVNHPISGVLDAYVDGPDLSPRWSFATIAGVPEDGWYLPFESYNPLGIPAGTSRRRVPVHPLMTSASAMSLKRQVRARPTDTSHLRDRMELVRKVAQAFLASGRRDELDSVLPPSRMEHLVRTAADAPERAAPEVDRRLIDLAELILEREGSAGSIFGIHDPTVPDRPVAGPPLFGKLPAGVDLPADVAAAGARWVRYCGSSSLIWELVEPRKGTYDWTRTDHIFGEGRKAALNPVVVVNSNNEWDRPNRVTGPKGDIVPRTTLPRDMGAYLAFLKKAVERYDGDGIDDAPGSPVVRYWEIQNEVDLKMSWMDTPENYALLLAESYRVIKEASQEAVVLCSAASGPDPREPKFGFPEFFVRVFAALAKARKNPAERFFDVSSFHVYNEHATVFPLLSRHVALLRQELDRWGYGDVPLWLTETSTHSDRPSDAPADIPAHPEAEQAADVVKIYVGCAAVNVPKVFWVTLTEWAGFGGEPGGYWDHVGLINNPTLDGKSHKKLAYFTFRRLSEAIGGGRITLARIVEAENGRFVCHLRTGGRSLWIAWADVPNAGDVSISGVRTSGVTVQDLVPSVESGDQVKDPASTFRVQHRSVDKGTVTIPCTRRPVLVEEQR
ncbi:MAG: hypothetical protein HY815_12165 [Candidatus Riflebacteria bacterium]|nr:hypothetical protein [Candidatus Riflebacteria bacterium]